jgi:methionyl aminopeptidase
MPPTPTPTITPAEIALAAAAADRVVQVHHHLARFIRIGHTLAQIDAEVARLLEALGCRSCFHRYKVGKCPPFPSQACLSVNDCVVHGTAGSLTRPLREGDLLKIDIGVTANGWIGDAAWTYSLGPPSPTVARLMQAGKESLARGVKRLVPQNLWLAWAEEVQGCVEREYGFHLIRGLGGHGYGRRLHAPPYVSNVVPRYPGEWPEATQRCAPGTLVAVEPMIAQTTGEIRQNPREWPVYSADGSMSVHYEHDVLITDDEPRVLTAGLTDLPDVVG